jgi:hypothetical protein
MELLQPAGELWFNQWLFVKLLGLVYLIAFASLLRQLPGLYGRNGLLPIADYLRAVRRRAGGKGFRMTPSLFWFRDGDRWLLATAWGGIVCAVLLICGLWPPLLLALLWWGYFSFVVAGRDFLSFQWDALLLEAGFISIFYALVTPPTPLMTAVYWFFVFRFMISAGVVKLTSGDPDWRRLRALDHHYQTQPLPNRGGWHAHQLPRALQSFSTLGTFFFELLVPLLFLLTAPLRLLGTLLSVLFQGLIMLTGNYGFFNLLTLVLLLPLVDGRYLAPLQSWLDRLPPQATAGWAALAVSLLFSVFFLANLLQLIGLFYPPARANRLLALLSTYLISNPYGLFAVMTTERLELIFEGSNDLEHWRAYEFRWKPGACDRAPGQAAPHMPRLDWQLWFAALRPEQLEFWVLRLLQGLLQGEPSVQALLKTVPFETPPTYLRVRIYRYSFTDRSEKRATGRWWRRTLIGDYPPVRLLPGEGRTTERLQFLEH